MLIAGGDGDGDGDGWMNDQEVKKAPVDLCSTLS